MNAQEIAVAAHDIKQEVLIPKMINDNRHSMLRL